MTFTGHPDTHGKPKRFWGETPCLLLAKPARRYSKTTFTDMQADLNEMFVYEE